MTCEDAIALLRRRGHHLATVLDQMHPHSVSVRIQYERELSQLASYLLERTRGRS